MAECHCGTCEHCVVPMRQEIRAAPVEVGNVIALLGVVADIDCVEFGHLRAVRQDNGTWSVQSLGATCCDEDKIISKGHTFEEAIGKARDAWILYHHPELAK